MENIELIKLRLSLGHNENIVGELTIHGKLKDNVLGDYHSEIKNTFEMHKDNIELFINNLINHVSALLDNRFDYVSINTDKTISCLETIQKEDPFDVLEISYDSKGGTCGANSKLLGTVMTIAADEKDLRNGTNLYIFKGIMDETKLPEIFSIRNLRSIRHEKSKPL